MTLRRRVWRAAAAVGTGQGASQALSLVRNILVARLLSPWDVGVAASLAVTLALVELLSDLSVDKVLIQSERGDEPAMQGTAQLVLILRGILLSLVLLALSGPVSALFNVPGARWAFACGALVPLIRGFTHLDPVRAQREMRYMPVILAEVCPQALVTAAAWPVAIWVGDYAAVLWLMIGQSVAMVVFSHLLAERPYRLSLDRRAVRTLTAFALPLLINGFLLFATNQGDKAIVGAAYPMEVLGVYAVASVLIGTPGFILAKTATALGLPMLARVQGSPGAFRARYSLCIEALCLIAVAAAIPLIVGGDRLVRLVYGGAYSGAWTYAPWLGAVYAVWAIRIGPTLGAMARGDTVNAVVANIWRASALIGVIGAVWAGAGLVWVAIWGLAGEVLALLASTRRLQRVHGVPQGLTLQPAALVALGIGAALLASPIAMGTGDALSAGLIVILLEACVLGAGAGLCPALRGEVVRAFRAARGRAALVAGTQTS